jgi:hypothetical protein
VSVVMLVVVIGVAFVLVGAELVWGIFSETAVVLVLVFGGCSTSSSGSEGGGLEGSYRLCCVP